jgi:hypothetical protein
MRRCHGYFGGCVVQHPVLHDRLGVLFLRENDDPCLLASDDFYSEDGLGLTKLSNVDFSNGRFVDSIHFRESETIRSSTYARTMHIPCTGLLTV